MNMVQETWSPKQYSPGTFHCHPYPITPLEKGERVFTPKAPVAPMSLGVKARLSRLVSLLSYPGCVFRRREPSITLFHCWRYYLTVRGWTLKTSYRQITALINHWIRGFWKAETTSDPFLYPIPGTVRAHNILLSLT